jgi:hypothetical protein
MDSRGYSSKIIKANLEADCQSPGVALGRFCISTEVPVKDTAEFFGVSRMTIYKWFTGQWIPRQKQAEKIQELLDRAGFKV